MNPFDANGRANIKNWLRNGTMGAIEHGGKIAGVIVAAAAINAALESGLHAAETAKSYSRNVKAGNTAYADLDAIDIAVDVQNATGNYFMTYEALDILLQRPIFKQMKFYIRDSAKNRDYAALAHAVERGLSAGRQYAQFLGTIADRLPEETRAFVLSSWYRNPKCHDCPHDAWLVDVALTPKSVAERQLNLKLRLLGAYHDKILRLEYLNVTDVSISAAELGRQNVGAWLYDEFNIADNGFVSHEIQWQKGDPWRVVAEKVLFSSVDKWPDGAPGEDFRA